jgi:aerobic-type carbon monoxide dehydrogenase small subunit (CoxS/CutS family)
MKSIELHVNGVRRPLEVEPERSLLSVLRDELDLTAAKAFGWGKAKKSPNCGFGIAGRFEKGGYVAPALKSQSMVKAAR